MVSKLNQVPDLFSAKATKKIGTGIWNKKKLNFTNVFVRYRKKIFTVIGSAELHPI